MHLPGDYVEFDEALFRRAGLRAFVSATTVYPKSGIGVQCDGVNDTLSNLQRTIYPFGHFGRTVAGVDGPTLRFSVADTENASIEAPARCEILAYPTTQTALPSEVNFWFGISLWLPDWQQTNDEQLIAQWHQNDTRLAVNPFMAVIVKGDSLRIEIRHSRAPLATRENIQVRTSAAIKVKPGHWFDLVFKAKLYTPGSTESTISAWQNGQLVLEHRGDVGYRLAPQAHAYAKAGIYKWRNGNAWDQRIPQRTVLLRTFVLIDDQRKTLVVEDIRDIVNGKKSLFGETPIADKAPQPRN